MEDDASAAVNGASKDVNTDEAKINQFQNEWNGTCVRAHGGRVRCGSVTAGRVL